VPRPLLELAEVFRRYGPAFRQAHAAVMPVSQTRVMTAIESCRTAALGGHVERCDRCGHQAISYNSCRNRHCPKCQGAARSKWLQARLNELLPVSYFHVVFTLPDSLSPIALQNKRLFYDILFRATSRTLLTIAKDPKHLGASIGFFAILHTWGQNLLDHPHLHCVVPSGGLSEDRKRWVPSRKRFLLSVRVLSRLFRRLFLADLQAAFDDHRLQLHGSLLPLAEPAAFTQTLHRARGTEWVVYSKPPFGGPEQVLRYLGRYTHRVALSNDRLLVIDDGKVAFTWKDYRHGNGQKVMTLEASEFIRRFLLHVLPDRFLKIRHFGLFGNRHRAKNLALCRNLLAASAAPIPGADSRPHPPTEPDEHPSFRFCPECGQGRMLRLQILPACTQAPSFSSIALDSS
jgi:hypothetical protein